MNVTCEKCGKRYVISDEKIAGKASVKIRCKQCQNLITVTAAPESARRASREQPAAEGGAWFAMIAGKQHGPYTLDVLVHRAAQGDITLRTYLWKSGMGDWKRAGDISEVSAVLVPPEPPAPAPAKAPKPKDIALAPETPAPDIVRRPSAQSGEGAIVAAQDSELLTLSPGLPEKKAEPFDPFAAISQGDGKTAPPIGEATRFFIAQAGVNKRNPPWKIALFVLAIVGGPLSVVYLLNTLHIVKLPTVTRTNEAGEEVEEPFFSGGGAAGLKDLLTGDAKQRKAAAEQQRKEREAAKTRAAVASKDAPSKNEPDIVKPKVQNQDLANFYGTDDRKSAVVPKIRGGGTERQNSTLDRSGLSQEAAMKIVADKSKAFQTCIDNALRRNPNLAVGNVTVVLNVGPSGAVKSTNIEPKKHENTDWGQCMMNTGKRIVFPSSDGETQLELPFKVGVAL